MKSNKNEFLKLLTAYQGIIHKVNRIYFSRKPTGRTIFRKQSTSLAVFPGVAE